MRARFSWAVLNATADDWEALGSILPDLQRDCGPGDDSVLAQEFVRLLRDGLLEEAQGRSMDVDEILSDPMEHWFRMTARGREIRASAVETYRRLD
jgi:hypothetical protein